MKRKVRKPLDFEINSWFRVFLANTSSDTKSLVC